MHRRLVLVCAAVTLVVAPLQAFAQAEAKDEGTEAAVTDSDTRAYYETGGLAGAGVAIGIRAGVGLGQVSSEFGITPVVELEIGYLLPVLDRSFEIFISGQYAQPMTDGTAEADPRLPGDGVMSYEATQRQAILTLGLIYRLPIPVKIFRPYLSIGGRAYFMRTEIDGKVNGESFGENTETATEFGVHAAIGGEVYLGPGGLHLEIAFGWSQLDGFIIRNHNTGSLNLMLGYRLFL